MPTPTPTPTVTPTPTPTPVPVAVKGNLRLKIEKTYRDTGRHIAFTRDSWRVRGEMRPYVAGQTVTIRFFRQGKQIHQQVEKLKPIQGGKVGLFETPFRAKGDGRITITAVHFKTPEMLTVRGNKQKVYVVKPVAGNSGTVVRMLQRGLSKLHYSTSRNGIYDSATARAVMAWRKMTGMARTFSASEAVVRGVLAGRGAFPVRYPKHGHHVEADLSKQVLALIDNGDPQHIYHISSANRRRRRCSAASTSTASHRARTRTGWCTRATSSAATRSMDTSTSRPMRRATVACACRSPARGRSSPGCAWATSWMCIRS